MFLFVLCNIKVISSLKITDHKSLMSLHTLKAIFCSLFYLHSTLFQLFDSSLFVSSSQSASIVLEKKRRNSISKKKEKLLRSKTSTVALLSAWKIAYSILIDTNCARSKNKSVFYFGQPNVPYFKKQLHRYSGHFLKLLAVILEKLSYTFNICETKSKNFFYHLKHLYKKWRYIYIII